MTSIGTEIISRGYTKRVPLFSLLPLFTKITDAPPRQHSSDGLSRFSSLSPYRPPFSNPSRQPRVGLDWFGAVAWPHTVGFSIIAVPPNWKADVIQTAAIMGAIVVFAVLLFLWIVHLNKKDREAAEHVRKGGEPRNALEREAKFFQELENVEIAPHILICPQGIIRYRRIIPPIARIIPPALLFLAALSKDKHDAPSEAKEDDSDDFKELDARILTLLEADPNLDLSKYATDLGIELVDFHRKNALPSPAAPRIFTLKNIVLSYELKDPAKSPDEIEQQLRLILDAHPSADLNALASDLGITIRNIQRRGDEGFQPYDLPIGTKSP